MNKCLYILIIADASSNYVSDCTDLQPILGSF